MVDGIAQIIIKSSLGALSKLSSQDVLSSTGEHLGYYMLKKLIRQFHDRRDTRRIQPDCTVEGDGRGDRQVGII